MQTLILAGVCGVPAAQLRSAAPQLSGLDNRVLRSGSRLHCVPLCVSPSTVFFTVSRNASHTQCPLHCVLSLPEHIRETGRWRGAGSLVRKSDYFRKSNRRFAVLTHHKLFLFLVPPKDPTGVTAPADEHVRHVCFLLGASGRNPTPPVPVYWRSIVAGVHKPHAVAVTWSG